MNNGYDTIKAMTREFDQRTLDLSSFKDTEKVIRGKIVPLKQLKDRPNGLVDFSYQPNTRQLIIEASAKIFDAKYDKHISLNNISDLIDILNGLGVVKLNKDDFIKYSECLKLHVVKDIHLASPPETIMGMLKKCHTNDKYYNLNAKYSTGFFFKPIAASRKDVFKMYLKHDELLRNHTKANKLLRPLINLDYFLDVIRLEGELNDFDAMRKYLDISSSKPIFLIDALTSTQDVIAKMFDEVFQNPADFSLKASPRSSFAKKANDLIFDPIYNTCLEDDHRAKTIIKCEYPEGFKHTYKKYLDWKAKNKLTIRSTDVFLKEFIDKVHAPYMTVPYIIKKS